MPRIKKGARLVWRDESFKRDGSLRNRAGWFIRDGDSFVSTGGGQTDLGEAERALARHIAGKHRPARQRGRDAADVLIADVVNVYSTDVVPRHAKPAETSARLEAILDFFGTRTLADITGELCRDYVAAAGAVPAARRQLEDLRAAVRHYHREGYSLTAPAIVLPEKSLPRERWLTRAEAARLIRAAWRMRQSYKGKAAWRRTGRHLARFMLVAVYTGTRSGAICGAALEPREGCGHVDLERGVFYRRAAGRRATKKRQPPVRIPDRLLAHLRRWATTPDRFGPVDGDGRPARRIAENFVVEWNGRPVGSIAKGFRSARVKAGLGAEVTPHIFRHTAATWLMQAGADPWEAAGFLGMTVEMLMDTYGHHHPDFQADAAEKITTKSRARSAPKNVVRLADRAPAKPEGGHPTVSPQKRRKQT